MGLNSSKVTRLQTAITGWRQKIVNERTAAEASATVSANAARVAAEAKAAEAKAAAEATAATLASSAQTNAVNQINTTLTGYLPKSGGSLTGPVSVGGSKVSSDGINFANLSSDPASPVIGQVYYNTTKGHLRQWNGTSWQQVAIGDSGFKYRTVITTGYVLGGYKDGSPWKNVNRMVHATDICTNLGDQLVYSASYIQGAPSKTKAWVFCAANAHSTASVNAVAMNMATESAIAYSSSNNMSTARQDAGVAFKENDYVHVLSNTTTDKFNFTTEVSALSGLSIIANGTGGGVQAITSDKQALIYGDGASTAIQFATDTTSTDQIRNSGTVPAAGANNQQKAINSKLYKGYAGNEGTYNGGYNFRRTDMTTNTTQGTVAKVEGNTGEENLDMGQDQQYMLGNYNGAQNNNGHKFFYATDAGFTLGAGSVRTGVPGGSSAATGWKG